MPLRLIHDPLYSDAHTCGHASQPPASSPSHSSSQELAGRPRARARIPALPPPVQKGKSAMSYLVPRCAAGLPVYPDTMFAASSLPNLYCAPFLSLFCAVGGTPELSKHQPPLIPAGVAAPPGSGSPGVILVRLSCPSTAGQRRLTPHTWCAQATAHSDCQAGPQITGRNCGLAVRR